MARWLTEAYKYKRFTILYERGILSNLRLSKALTGEQQEQPRRRLIETGLHSSRLAVAPLLTYMYWVAIDLDAHLSFKIGSKFS